MKNEERAFFCSELVAKAYKEVGLFETQKASSSFYPCDFASDGKVQLQGEARLGEELVITFDEERLQQDYEDYMTSVKKEDKKWWS